MVTYTPLGLKKDSNNDPSGIIEASSVSSTALSAISLVSSSIDSSSISAITFSAVSAVVETVSATSGCIGSGCNSTAILDVNSTTKSFLPPRMTTTQRNAVASPAAGSVIYNTTTNLLNHYNGSAWLAVGAVAAGASETVAFYDALGGTQTVVILNGLIVSWTAS